MDKEQLVNTLTTDDIVLLLEHFNAEPHHEKRDDTITALTVCHDSEKPKRKLYYYPANKNFYCYTHCHSIGNVVDFTMKVLNIDFGKAFYYLLDFYGIHQGYEKSSVDKMDCSYYKNVEIEQTKYKSIDKAVLRDFKGKLYHSDWIEEGLSPVSMEKFNILFDAGRCYTVIPHYDMEGELIGIRRRAYLPEDIARGKYTPLHHNGILYNHSLGGNLYGLNQSLPHIKDYRTLVIFEGEKSVIQLDSFMEQEGIGVAVCGSNLTQHQIQIIINLVLSGQVDEVVIGLDKEFEKAGTRQEQFYAQKVRQTFCEPLLPYCKVSVLWDREDRLDYKDSPTDKGRTIYNYLFKNRIVIQ